MSIADWFGEVIRTAPARTHLPGTTISARAREEIAIAVAGAAGARWCEWVHGSWRELLGNVDGDVPPAVVLDYARASAVAGRPIRPGEELETLLPPAAVRAVRATIARTNVECRLPLPLQLPLIAAGAAMRTVQHLAPAPPEVEVPAEPNLLTHLLANAARAVVANAAARLAVLNVPATVVVGFRAGRSAATVRFGRSGVAVDNGIAPDTWVVLEGDIEPLLRMASGSVLRDLARFRVGR